MLCVFCAIFVRLKCSNISASLIKPRLKDIKQMWFALLALLLL
ncbi:MAG: hypothetical protein PUB35_04965 [Campylobacteraceae bacterium]|nr:hypothetical protein [Campylobacteraceae bacterium]